MSDTDDLHKRIKAMADVVNAFKSESVQLRVVEVLLSQLGSSSGPATPASPKAERPKRRKAARKAAANTPATAVAEKEQPATRRKAPRSSGSPGAFAMISQLLSDGFFKSPQTIGAIVKHCGTSKGHHYKANECSPALLRLLRDGKLKRQKNADSQYEYTQA
jgi:hypothetical protein